MQTIEATGRAGGFRFALVVSAYHDFITDKLQAAALAVLATAGADPGGTVVVRVPGAFEIPIAAQHAAATGRYDAVICLGCLIRGDTPHFDYIAAAVSHGLTAAAAATGVPMAFGVLTTNTVAEAIARASDDEQNKGREAARAAVDMASVVAQLSRLPRET